MAETQQDIVNQIGREDEEERLNQMTKTPTYTSEGEIQNFLTWFLSDGKMGELPFANDKARRICKQAKLAASAIAEAKALRALIAEAIETSQDVVEPWYGLQTKADKIPLLQQGEDK